MTYLNHHRDGRRERERRRPVRVYAVADRERESVWRPSEEIWPAARDHEVEHGNDTGRQAQKR